MSRKHTHYCWKDPDTGEVRYGLKRDMAAALKRAMARMTASDTGPGDRLFYSAYTKESSRRNCSLPGHKPR